LGAESFEGVVRFEAKDPKGRVSNLDYFLKGNMTRVEADNSRLGRLTVVLRDRSGESLCLIDEKRTYASRLRIRENAPQALFSNDGSKKLILGQVCEHLVLKRRGGPIEIWACHGLGVNFRSFESGPFSRAPQPAWEEALIEQDYFPLEIEEDGHLSIKAVSFQKKSLPDSLFEVPAGYTESDLEKLDRP
jgi:hypothetical protein